MKNASKILTLTVAGALIASSLTFAVVAKQNGEAKEFGGNGIKGGFNVDPAKALESFKANIAKRVADGKLTQEQADKMIADMEARTKEMQEFNSMTLEQKKSTLIEKAKEDFNKAVAGGRLTQEQADERLQQCTEKINAWDGTGRPPMAFGMGQGKDGNMMKGRPQMGNGRMEGKSRDNFNANSLEGFYANISKKVADGKLTQEQADKMIADMKAKIQEVMDFNSMTLEQKKVSLIAKVKANLDKVVADNKLTQEQADKLLVARTEKINAWDGVGRPPFGFGDGQDRGKGMNFRKGGCDNCTTAPSEQPDA